LTSVIHYIATGSMPQTLTMPTGEGEVRRQLTSTLKQGRSITVYDNIERMISSPAFASVLTTEKWSDRILGQSQIKTFTNNMTWIANGNNIQLGGDISRRCYLIQLDPKSSRPWARTDFRHLNLIQHVKKNRSELLSAILIIIRAWYSDGQPAAVVKQMGSFEEWTRIVGGILKHAGFNGFLENLDTLYRDSDDESNQFKAFLSAWLDHLGDKQVTAKEVSQTSLIELIPETVFGGSSSGNITQKLGKMFAKYAGTRFGDDELHIVKMGLRHNTQTWQVVKVEK